MSARESNISSPLMVGENSSTRREASGDPYYVYKEELEGKVADIQQQYTKWKVISARPNAPEFFDTTRALTRALKSAQDSLTFLEQTVKMVESRPSQFKHIDSTELKERQSFLSQTKSTIEEMAAAVSCDAVRSRLKASERKKLQRLDVSKSKEEWARDNTEFIKSEQQRQEELITEQDDNLDELGKSVAHLGVVAVGIHDEIDSQNKMLEDMSYDVDQAQERMNFVMGRMSKLLQTKDKCQLGSILILTLVLVVMVFLVLYT